MPFSTGEDAVQIYYEDIGSGPSVVMVHGFAASHAVWETVVSELKAQYRIITLDLRGHGESDKPSEGCNIQTFTRDIRNLAANLELQKFDYVGWSAGASIGLELAATTPAMIRKLILVGGSPCWGQKPDFPWGHSVETVGSWDKEISQDHAEWMYRTIETMFAKPPSEKRLLWMWNIGMQLPIHAALEMINDAAKQDLRDKLAKITARTLVLHGSYDKFNYLEAAKYMAAEINNSKMVVFEESGHVPFLEESERFLRELRTFLQE